MNIMNNSDNETSFSKIFALFFALVMTAFGIIALTGHKELTTPGALVVAVPGILSVAFYFSGKVFALRKLTIGNNSAEFNNATENK